MKWKPRCHGFSLIELILVIAVIALVGVISFPILMPLYQKQGVAVATGSVAAHIQEARSYGLFGLDKPRAVFTAGGSAYTKGGGKDAIVENGCFSVNAVSVEFASLGQLIDPSADLVVTIRDPSAGNDGVITITTPGMITWSPAP